MRSTLFILFVSASFFLTACSSPEVTNTNTNRTIQQTGNVKNVESNTNEIAVKNSNTNEKFAIPGINEPIDNSAARAANSKPESKPEKVTVPAGRPAPDDSIFTTQLTDVGLETRTFKSDPQLKKVERITSAKGKTIKVYLRSGKVIELQGDKLQNLPSIPASEILKAVGIVLKEQPALPPKSKELEQKVQ